MCAKELRFALRRRVAHERAHDLVMAHRQPEVGDELARARREDAGVALIDERAVAVEDDEIERRSDRLTDTFSGGSNPKTPAEQSPSRTVTVSCTRPGY